MPLTRLPPLASLRAFEAAARRGSIKDAAEELAVTPGAVSQQIKALEADLGVLLFARKTRAIYLTAEGQRLQPTVTEAFLQLRQAVDQIRPGGTRRLRINSTNAIISKWLLPRLHRFNAANPNLTVHIETEPYLNPMTEYAPDVLISHYKSAPWELYAKPIYRELILPVAAPRWLDDMNIKTPDDIARATILHDTSLTFFKQPSSWELWAKAAKLRTPLDLSRAIIFEPHAADQVIDAAVSGAGITIARSLLAYSALSDGRLICPFGPVIESGMTYYVCCREGREEEPHIQSFLSWACKEAAVLSTLNALLEPPV